MWWQRKKGNELDEEIRAHFALEVKQRIDAGETREDAERAARRQFGNVALVTVITRPTRTPATPGLKATPRQASTRPLGPSLRLRCRHNRCRHNVAPLNQAFENRTFSSK
jgi:hypothetical protein